MENINDKKGDGEKLEKLYSEIDRLTEMLIYSVVSIGETEIIEQNIRMKEQMIFNLENR